ncbi:MAG: autotransporter outer membrane beta-barrel domain-containing protein [Rhodospirillaceae bacterium]|nr:autotransporter outer membrane beta-barrel domain-containing protein [Rhodospirillaceae bacterium]
MRPVAGITAQRYWQNGYSETGAGIASLHYDDMTRNSVVSRLGTAVEFDTVLYGARVLPAVSLGWAHSLSDRSAKMDVAFASAPNSRFTTRGADMSRNALELGFSAEMIGNDNGLSVTAGYGGSFASDARDHSFGLRVRLRL